MLAHRRAALAGQHHLVDEAFKGRCNTRKL